MMKNFTNEFKNVYNAATGQDVAKGEMSASRLALAQAFHADGFNPENAIDKLKLKEKILKAFPNGVGKHATPDEKAAVSNVRQCVSCYAKGKKINMPPTGFETFAAWREKLYPPVKETKCEIIKGWINSEKIVLTVKDVQDLLDTYIATTINE